MLSHLTPANFSELIRIAEEKQSLLARIEKIDATMETLITRNAVPAAAAKPVKSPAKPAAPKAAKRPASPTAPGPIEPAVESAPPAPAPVRAKRGALKEGILAALATAGAGGLSVSDLASQLGAEAANVHVWFSTTGKKLAEITKVAAGRYALAGEASVTATEAPAAPESTPEATAEAEITPAAEAATVEPEPEPEPVVGFAVEAPTVVEEITVAEFTIELDPEAAAASVENEEDPAPAKRDEFELRSFE